MRSTCGAGRAAARRGCGRRADRLNRTGGPRGGAVAPRVPPRASPAGARRGQSCVARHVPCSARPVGRLRDPLRHEMCVPRADDRVWSRARGRGRAAKQKGLRRARRLRVGGRCRRRRARRTPPPSQGGVPRPSAARPPTLSPPACWWRMPAPSAARPPTTRRPGACAYRSGARLHRPHRRIAFGRCPPADRTPDQSTGPSCPVGGCSGPPVAGSMPGAEPALRADARYGPA